MRLPRTPAFLMAAALAAGCSAPPSPTVAPALPELPTLTVEAQTTARQRSWEGVVQAVNQATLTAQTAGRVLELPFDVNDFVEAGDVVVRFSDVEQRSGRTQAEAAVRAARASLKEADAELGRVSDLVARQLISRAQFDQAQARRDAAAATLAAAEAMVSQAGEQVDYTVVRAPYSGLLTQRHVQLGESVRPGQPLVSGLSLDRLRVEVAVPQADVAAIRSHQQASIRLQDGREIAAEKLIVFPYADPATHAFTVRVELPEMESGLLPGQTVRVRFKLGEYARVMVPTNSVVRRSEVHAVYVLTDAGALLLRQIRLGETLDDQVEVLAGLGAGERVVLDPAAALNALQSARGGAQ